MFIVLIRVMSPFVLGGEGLLRERGLLSMYRKLDRKIVPTTPKNLCVKKDR